MGLLGAIVNGLRSPAAVGDVNDERLWEHSVPVWGSATGLYVSPAHAFQVSCIFQGVRLIAETLGSLPLHIVRERPGGGKEKVTQHFAWELLRKGGRPNAWQTSMEWREMAVAHALGWGLGLSEVKYQGPLGVELWSQDPDTVEKVEQTESGRLRYVLRKDDGSVRTLMDEESLALRGIGVRPTIPINVLWAAREAIGLWLAQERYGATFFGRGTSQRVVLEHPGKLTEPAQKRLRRSFESHIAGPDNWHRPWVAEEGMKAHEIGFSPRDSQVTEQREDAVREIGRWLNVPTFLLMAKDNPPYASVTQFARQFVDYTLRSWAERLESIIDRDLLFEPELSAKHDFRQLLRGDMKERFEAYALGIMNGILSENEAREWEDLNPVDGLDEPRRSVNQDRGSAPEGKRLELLSRSAAERIVRLEQVRITKLAAKNAADGEAWRVALEGFYREHRLFVAEALQIPPGVAGWYCERRRTALEQGPEVDGWQGAADDLVSMAMEA